MADLPGGTVTLLFTDIQGSTALWERNPEVMRHALARHDALVAQGVQEHGGTVVKAQGEGDSVFAVFPRATFALSSAIAIQRALHAEPWPAGTLLRVRMALHTGEAELRDGNYFGTAVNRCARLRAVGHGGQILISGVTAELVRDALPPGVVLEDLGEHRLQDLTRSERIFQVRHRDLPAEFPSLRTLDARVHNLPVLRGPLIGREESVASAREYLLRSDVGLLTFTGPGGTGKTRLALQVAAELLDAFADGVFFVALAPVRDPAVVPSAIARVLGVQEGAGRPLRDALLEYLAEKHVLLLLDNFEQITPAAPFVADLLRACPRLKVLVTSRALLHVYGEHDFPVPPLTLPDREAPRAVEQLTQYAAVRLFVERALEVRQTFAVTNENAPAVAEICHRLDGLPLAIELAAARSRLLTPQAILARLERRLPLLTGGALDLPQRQQTLRGAIAWSYDLLTPQEQALFRRLSVFLGGCSLEMAEAVCNPDGDLDVFDGVVSLVDKSLVRQSDGPDGEPRFWALETIREYGSEQLEACGEVAWVRRRHAELFLQMVEELELQLFEREQRQLADRLETEHPNLRAALTWGQTEPTADDLWIRLAGALRWFWWLHGHFGEGRRWLDAAVVASGGTDPTAAAGEDGPRVSASARAKVLGGAGHLAWGQGDHAWATVLLDTGIAVARAAGNMRELGYNLVHLVAVARTRVEYERTVGLCEESIAVARGIGDVHTHSLALYHLGFMARARGEYTRATAFQTESLALRRRVGDTWGIAWSLHDLGLVALGQGEDEKAKGLFEESLVLHRDLDHRRGIAWVLNDLGSVALIQGDVTTARERLIESLRLRRELGDRRGIAECLESFAAVAVAEDRLERAARLLGAATAVREAIGAPLWPTERDRQVEREATVRRKLDRDAFATAWADGRALELEAAMTFATEAAAVSC